MTPPFGPDRSGTYNILALIEHARTLGLPHVYLGYYIAGCPSMAYKVRFAPNQILGPEGHWAISEGEPARGHRFFSGRSGTPMNRFLRIAALTVACVLPVVTAHRAVGEDAFTGLKEVNPPAGPEADRVIAIVGARLIDGRRAPAVPDSAIVIRGSRIVQAGLRSLTVIPDEAHMFDASGLWVLPGLIDTHFHNEGHGAPVDLPALVLSRGITTLRDPSLPIADFDPVRHADRPMPRCFLTGRHFDQEPHAYPHAR